MLGRAAFIGSRLSTDGCPWPTRARDFTRHHARLHPCQATLQVVPRLRAGQASMSAAVADLFVELVAARLSCGVRRHDDALIHATSRAVSFPRPRSFATAGTQKYHAQACSLGVSEPGVTESTLALQSAAPQARQPPSRQVPRSHKSQLALRHCSACTADSMTARNGTHRGYIQRV